MVCIEILSVILLSIR